MELLITTIMGTVTYSLFLSLPVALALPLGIALIFAYEPLFKLAKRIRLQYRRARRYKLNLKAS